VPSNREISGLIKVLNWEIGYCLARSFRGVSWHFAKRK
jgi:hypothetical protein